MKQNWNETELESHWNLDQSELAYLDGRTDISRLGFSILLKFFQQAWRFPEHKREVPRIPVEFLARQLGVAAALWQDYPLTGRTAERARSQIRQIMGFRPATLLDGEQLQQWLVREALQSDPDPQHLREAAFGWFRQHRFEPLGNERIERLVAAATHQFETAFFTAVQAKLTSLTQANLLSLLSTHEHPSLTKADDHEEGDEASPFSFLKTDSGRASLKSVEREVVKLEIMDALGLPNGLFTGTSSKILRRYRLRAATESVWQLRRHPEPIRYGLLAAFCWQRRQEIRDSLVDLLLQIIHKLSVKAEKRVYQELVGELEGELEKVAGKTTLLFRLAEAAVQDPDGVIRDVLFPVVGESTLAALVKEYHSHGPTYRRQVHHWVRRSYSHHYRRMVPLLLKALSFRSNNTQHQPVITAIAWLQANQDDRRQSIPTSEVPIDGVVRPKLQGLLLETVEGGQRINRIDYEICLLQTLRERLRCKEIWVEGADRYRNPADDLPQDFAERRAEYYQALDLPSDPETFIQQIQEQMAAALSQLDRTLPDNPKVRLRPDGKNRIVVTPYDPQPTPTQLERLKTEVNRRWPMTSLLDVLKEADLRIGFSDVFTTLGSRENLDRATLQQRLLLCLYGLGTNTGLKRMVSGRYPVTYPELLYVRRRYLEKDALREAIRQVINATLAIRHQHIWGEATTACAADGKKFGSWDQNLMTEWHIRYGGRGVMIYWHVEKRSACIYSQLKRCSSSEVASMMEGVLRHCTDLEVSRQYVDSHGQSTVAFAFAHLLRFDLLPRLKALASQKLYRPKAGQAGDYPNLEPVLTRPINWELIRQQYDEIVKYTTALRLGTAEPESILKRFTRENAQHPTYQALQELGKAVKTLFLCRYLESEALRQEIHEGLNVVENWNSANSFIFYGKGGEIATNRLEDQELAVLSLHLVQASLVYVNTLMLQQVLAEPTWMGAMKAEDLRGLSPLIYAHINPYGLFELDMEQRLPLESHLVV